MSYESNISLESVISKKFVKIGKLEFSALKRYTFASYSEVYICFLFTIENLLRKECVIEISQSKN